MERFEEVLINTSVEMDQLLIEKVHDLYHYANCTCDRCASPFRTQS